eukprot:365471-Chlamydomonas_euryale.AAC.16
MHPGVCRSALLSSLIGKRRKSFTRIGASQDFAERTRARERRCETEDVERLVKFVAGLQIVSRRTVNRPATTVVRYEFWVKVDSTAPVCPTY